MFLLSHFLKHFIKVGTLIVIDADGKRHTFSGTAGPHVTFRLTDKSLHRRLFFSPDLALGEGYMDGTLQFEGGTIYDFLYLFNLNKQSFATFPLQVAVKKFSKAFRFLQPLNSIGAARKNVAHHYDLSRELYLLFLDVDQQYSCAYFEDKSDTLEQAQLN